MPFLRRSFSVVVAKIVASEEELRRNFEINSRKAVANSREVAEIFMNGLHHALFHKLVDNHSITIRANEEEKKPIERGDENN